MRQVCAAIFFVDRYSWSESFAPLEGSTISIETVDGGGFGKERPAEIYLTASDLDVVNQPRPAKMADGLRAMELGRLGM